MDRNLTYNIQFNLEDRATAAVTQIRLRLQQTGEAADEAARSASRTGTALSVASTASVRGFQQTSAVIDQLGDRLAQVSRTAGQAVGPMSQVGDTARGFNTLNMSIQQVARELPAFAVSANTGFLAVSNNLPILADAISNVRQRNAALAAQGLATVPVWRQVASSLMSWQTALVAGITVLTLYGPEIGSFISRLFNLSAATDQNRLAMEALQATNRNYNTQLLQESAQLRDLYSRLLQTSEGTSARKALIDQLNDSYKEYMPYLLTERSSLAELNTAYEAINSALRNHIALKVRSSEMDKITEEAAKAQAEAIETLQKAFSEQRISPSMSDNLIASLVGDAPKWREAGDNVQEAFLQAVKNMGEAMPGLSFTRDTRRGIQDYLESFYQMENAVDAVNKRVDLLMGRTNQIRSIGEVVVTPDASKTSQNLNTDLQTIGGLQTKIQQLRDLQNRSSAEQAANLEREIQLYEQKLNALQRTIAQQAAGNLGEGEYSLPLESAMPQGLQVPEILIPMQFDTATLRRSWQEAQQIYSDSIQEIEISGRQISGMLTGALTSFASGLGEAIASGSGLEAMKSLLTSIMGMLQQFGSALIAAGVASQAFQSLFANPFAGIAAGIALVAAASAAKAALQNATAFADGGIVSGPTLAMVGEYAGARNNPEVIAPLNKLRSLINPVREADEWNGTVRFVIAGSVLEGILDKQNRKRTRTR